MSRIMSTPIPAPFAEGRDVVRPEWIDYNGHMNVGYYQVVFDFAADVFFDFLGLTQEFRKKHGSTTFALEAHANFLREVKEGAPLRFEAQRGALDRKSTRLNSSHTVISYAVFCL